MGEEASYQQQNSCGGALSFLLLWLWLLTWLGCNILLHGKSGGMQEGGGAEMGVMDGYCLPAPRAASAGYEGWAAGSPSSVQAAVKKRSYISPRSPFLGGLLLPSSVSPCCSSCLMGEKRIFVGSPGFNPGQSRAHTKISFPSLHQLFTFVCH